MQDVFKVECDDCFQVFSEIPGTGLGLAIAKEYAQLNDAKVFVSNNSPKGSTFHLLMESIEN